MEYIEEIRIREELFTKAANGIKLEKEEHLWLTTHCTYNSKIGYPYLNKDIIKLEPNVLYDVCVRCEFYSYPYKVSPVIGVADLDGEIITDFELKDFYGNKSKNQTTKMLALSMNETGKELCFKIKSKAGLMSVAYECEHYVDWLGRTIKEISDSGKFNFAMNKKCDGDFVLYECKDPDSDNFNIFSFSVNCKISK